MHFSNDWCLLSDALVRAIFDDINASISSALIGNGYVCVRRVDLMDEANMRLMGGEMG